jgi:hypothetical protein
MEIHTAEPLVPETSPSEVEIAIARLKKHKSPGSDQIPAELIQAGGETLQSEIHELINSIWSKEELSDQWIINFIQNFNQYPSLKVKSICRQNYWG